MPTSSGKGVEVVRGGVVSAGHIGVGRSRESGWWMGNVLVFGRHAWFRTSGSGRLLLRSLVRIFLVDKLGKQVTSALVKRMLMLVLVVPRYTGVVLSREDG
jgi:hypothetical protein